MSIPFIKFLAFTISYFAFVAMIIISSLQFQNDQNTRDRFSLIYPEYTHNFSAYIQSKGLNYQFKPYDFYIRKDKPDYLDIVICIWLFGNFFSRQ